MAVFGLFFVSMNLVQMVVASVRLFRLDGLSQVSYTRAFSGSGQTILVVGPIRRRPPYKELQNVSFSQGCRIGLWKGGNGKKNNARCRASARDQAV
jgi:hypothetical protein